MPVLPDVLAPGLALVLCGTGAGRKSAALGAYYANPGNKFWPTLHTVGLTPSRFAPAAFRDLSALGIGLTDIAKEHIGQDTEIDPAGADADGLRRRIARVAPGILAFTSKRAASLYLGRPTGTIGYAFQDETIGRTRLFVLPSPSGAAASHWDIAPWHALARAVKEMRGG
jgi:TDG/mug DNA glycosylase family protein